VLWTTLFWWAVSPDPELDQEQDLEPYPELELDPELEPDPELKPDPELEVSRSDRIKICNTVNKSC
jgi:hypothetical protein